MNEKRHQSKFKPGKEGGGGGGGGGTLILSFGEFVGPYSVY